jgi:putative oxidoreductase
MGVRVQSFPIQPPTGKSLANAGLVAARVVLGLIFTASGASIVFFLASSPPPAPGLAGTFQDVFFRSHWVVFVDAVEFVAGVLLLINRFVPLALVLLGAVISNILAFHLTMQTETIALPLLVLALWIVLAHHHRASLEPLFRQR